MAINYPMPEEHWYPRSIIEESYKSRKRKKQQAKAMQLLKKRKTYYMVFY